MTTFSIERDVLTAGQTTGQNVPLRSTNRHVIAILDTLNSPQCLRDSLRLVRKLQKKLLAKRRPLQSRPRYTLGAGNRATGSIQNKVGKVIVLHVGQHLSTQRIFAFANGLDLGLKSTNLIVCGNPRT